MDAVRSYIEKAGGKLSINLLEKTDSIDEAVPAEFTLTLDSRMFTVVKPQPGEDVVGAGSDVETAPEQQPLGSRLGAGP